MAPNGWSPASLQIAIAMMLMLTIQTTNSICPFKCRCDDETLRTSCRYADLEVVPIQLNPDIRDLDLSHNRVSSLHTSFAFYSKLERLDLSSNQIHTLGSENFDLQGHLTVLNISNNSIATLTKNALCGLKELKELDLSMNNISDLDHSAFKYTSELEVLNLAGNSLTSLPNELLRNLHVIRTLILSRNSLLEVPTENLALAPSLERLDLADNLIQELGKDSLPGLTSLMTLNLANNVIRSISGDAFDRLPGLLDLDLSGNNLTNVPTSALSKLSLLSTLSLNRNPIESLDSVAFRNLFELRSLELDDCSITSVHPRSFADNVNLERISLSGNHKLRELPARVLYGSRYLRLVSLRHCSLETLQPTQFPVDGLSSLKVGGNPLICNCSVHWLWNVIREEERRNETRLELDTQDIVCADEEFSGKRLMTLTESSLRCRLSRLYLSLSAAGCLAATATILIFIAHLTKIKRKKRLSYTASNRPEFLVYVGTNNDKSDKNAESYNRRLLTRQDDSGATYDTPRAKKTSLERGLESLDANIYETPRYNRPPPPPFPVPSNVATSITSRRDLDRYERHTGDDEDVGAGAGAGVGVGVGVGGCGGGVYAVADVTGLRDEPPEVLSLYRMQNPSRSSNLQRSRDYDYNDYDYDYDYEPSPLSDKPHVVFV